MNSYQNTLQPCTNKQVNLHFLSLCSRGGEWGGREGIERDQPFFNLLPSYILGGEWMERDGTEDYTLYLFY